MQAFAYMAIWTCLSALWESRSRRLEPFPSLQHEPDDIGIVVNPVKTVALPPKGHAPTAEEIRSLKASTSTSDEHDSEWCTDRHTRSMRWSEQWG